MGSFFCILGNYYKETMSLSIGLIGG